MNPFLLSSPSVALVGCAGGSVAATYTVGDYVRIRIFKPDKDTPSFSFFLKRKARSGS